eukprot:COSAG05_NODE_2113_length_3545_cov_82.901335_1_plen_65_part_00
MIRTYASCTTIQAVQAGHTHGKEGGLGLGGDRLADQCLARPRRPEQQKTLHQTPYIIQSKCLYV